VPLQKLRPREMMCNHRTSYKIISAYWKYTDMNALMFLRLFVYKFWAAVSSFVIIIQKLNTRKCYEVLGLVVELFLQTGNTKT
jgi:hypothetical protein